MSDYTDTTFQNHPVSANFQKVFGPPIETISQNPDKWQKDPNAHKVAVNTYLQYLGQWRGLLPSPFPVGSAEEAQLATAQKLYTNWGLGPSAFYVMEIAGKTEVQMAWPQCLVYQTEFMDFRPFHYPHIDFNVEAHIMDAQTNQIEHGQFVANPYPKLDAATKKKNEALRPTVSEPLAKTLAEAAADPSNLRL